MSSRTLVYVPGSQVHVSLPEGSAHLRIEIDDMICLPAARVKRVFPLSSPQEYLSIQDAAGKEVAIVATPAELDESSGGLVARELDRRYFTPSISKVDMLRQEAGMWRFTVQTQRGPADFYVRNWRDSAHEIAPSRWQITSVDGQRFEIQSLDALDPRSQSLLEQLF